ncbi:phage regulatory CII family protein [Rhizobium sp. 768_B6_N1_8]|uniref:phage regulatory CII family protein n=1 Tax=unclassified Rhizobium TaxID=2613769 RepID=UPI003F28BDBA
MRTISEVDIRAIKAATEAAYTLGGGVTAFPDLTRVNVSTLSKYASFNDEYRESVIPCDIAVEADRRAKSPVIVSAMARQLGFRLVPDAPEIAETGSPSENDALRVMSEASDVLKEILRAREDGNVDALDKKRIAKELHELIRAAESVLAKVEVTA